ncbi:hypothetical protein AXI59_12815 [Bacillus nakamurai]|nr:hypothetical protein AXI59_12815 [Bacillus nakamurai]
MKKRFKRIIRFSCAAFTAGLLLMSAPPESAAFWRASNELLHDPTTAKRTKCYFVLKCNQVFICYRVSVLYY